MPKMFGPYFGVLLRRFGRSEVPICVFLFGRSVQAQRIYPSFWALGDVVEGPKKTNLGLSKKTPPKQAVLYTRFFASVQKGGVTYPLLEKALR